MFKIALLAALAPALVLAASDCARTYTVVEGDVCDSISAAHNSSTYQLAVVNVDSIDETCSNLMPKQQLCLGTAAEEDCKSTYVVQAGDSCEKVYSTFSLNSTILYANNPQINKDCSNIYSGEVLCVAQNVQVPPSPAKAPAPAPAAPTGSSATTTGRPPVVSAPAPAPSPAPADNNDDDNDDGDDDEDLPWCDEL